MMSKKNKLYDYTMAGESTPLRTTLTLSAEDFYAGSISVPVPSGTVSVSPPVEYKYSEGELLQEITEYVNKTYGEHYSQNNYQATEFIIDGGHGEGFTIGNILKYAQRYGQKGDAADWRKDLMKVIHYAIIALHVHDLNHKG